ncbi:MAG: alpha/beta fold hydrolase [Propionibacteriaceae bacterium]|jgi:carboxylesterase|nr:alpha/beta fold hydrolase [Propionibacteriaceae bacterium]
MSEEIPEFAEPIACGSGPVGILISHGFTSTPHSVSEWAHAVADAGYRVRVPRLPGHGTNVAELNRTSWQDWYDAIEREYETLRGECEEVFAGGLSLGGSLVLRLAEMHPDVRGLVLVNPAMVPTLVHRLAPLLQHMIPILPSGVGSDIAMPDVKEYTYSHTPVRATVQLLKLWQDVRARLDLITCPVLMFRSTVDHVVPDIAKRTILAQISSEDVVERLLPRSYHVATMDYDKQDIFDGTIKFLDEHRTVAAKA